MSDEYSPSLHRASAEYRDFDLPPADTKRWVTRRKAVIVNAVRTGVISLEEVCRRYELSVEEFFAWQRAIDTHGVPGLRVTRLQIYRDNSSSRQQSLVGKGVNQGGWWRYPPPRNFGPPPYRWTSRIALLARQKSNAW